MTWGGYQNAYRSSKCCSRRLISRSRGKFGCRKANTTVLGVIYGVEPFAEYRATSSENVIPEETQQAHTGKYIHSQNQDQSQMRRRRQR